MSTDDVRGWERQMWNFEINLSAKDIISWHTSKPGVVLFIFQHNNVGDCWKFNCFKENAYLSIQLSSTQLYLSKAIIHLAFGW